MSFVEHSFVKPHFATTQNPLPLWAAHFVFPDQNSLPSRLLTTAMAGLCRLTAVVQPAARRRIGTIARRSYGSAAVAYDYDYEEYESEPYRFSAMEDMEGSVPARGVQWVIMGDPLAKKHVYAERLSELIQVPHISMGALVRQELHPQSSLYKQIANAVNQGKLVPEEIIFGLLSKRLEEGLERGETGFILDGIPRTRMQAEILDKIADIDLVVNFKCTEECLLNQGMRNGIYSHSQELLCFGNSGLSLNRQSQDNGISSSADNTWKEKLRLYAEQIKPLEDYYRKQRSFLTFKWLVHLEKPGKVFWQHYIFSI